MPEYIVGWNGEPVASVKTAFATAVRLAGFEEDTSRHVLRHTAATWLMQQGVNLWEAADYLRPTPEMLQRSTATMIPTSRTRKRGAIRTAILLARVQKV
ncbi:tyrosine-type recombinase/integrase [Methylobacterium sp. R2-1]|uniref:tyrosine-type recombinase/integrase n=1 Tax=Methylobacterium sp. R2-1 TaxID=2587064 RepID=UPI00161EFAF0|nr:tyrosine-type recombinase/integrase [Methylobacterium sp. R2-1]MBB2964701.1 integrase [Methylobacterium sp. R2-1]